MKASNFLNLASIVGVALSISAVAHAATDLVDYHDDSQDIIDAAKDAAKADDQDKNKAWTKVEKKLTKLETKQAEEKARLTSLQAEKDALDKQHDAIQSEIDTLKSEPTAPRKKFLGISIETAQEREIKAKQKQLDQLNDQLNQENTKINKLTAKITSYDGAIQTNVQSAANAKSAVDAANVEWVRRQNPNEADQRTAATQAANDILDKVKENYFSAKLLTTDMSVLQQKHKLTAVEADVLREQSARALDNTLLGSYVQHLLASTCSDEQFRNVCAAGRSDDVMKYIGNKFGIQPTVGSPQSSDGSNKPAAAAATTAPAAGPAAQQAQ